MRSVRDIILLLVLLISLGMPGKDPAKAQDEHWEIRINQISTIEGPDAMLLKVYANIYDDRTGTPMLSVDAQSAQITLLNTNYTSNGVIKKPDVPIYITLVLDSSGSMGGAAPALIKAAKQSLNNTPDNSLFSVVQFDEEIKLLQDFTENIPALSYAIDHYQVSQKGTCLYDAAFSAVEAMAKAPMGRRAVILFTDGKDETREGQLCSKHTYQELVDLAMSSQVPISTIGLSYKDGAINTLELESLASSTGGISAIASQDDLATKFEDIMLALKAQWMVEVPIYPRRGNNDAVLNITLKNGASFTTTFAVTSNTDYPGPPSPVSVSLAGLLFLAAEQLYEVQLNMTSPDLVEYIRIEVWDEEAGSRVGDEYTFYEPSTNNRLDVPAESLTEKRAYELRISAISKQDQTPFKIGSEENGNSSTQLVHPFFFDPAAAYPNLTVQSVVEKNGDLILNVNVTNPDLVDSFEGWLVDETTNTQVLKSNFTAPPFSTSIGTITIPTRVNRIQNGQYTVVVRVIGKNGNDYSTVSYEGVTYTAPTFLERLGRALVTAPIYLFAILAIILAVIGFLMFNASHQKSLSGTPVLQGRLGGKLRTGRKGATPLIPVSDDEPISPRDISSLVSTSIKAPPATVSSQPATPAPTEITGVPEDSTFGNATVIDSSSEIPRAALTDIKGGGFTPPNGSTLVAPLPFIIGRSEGILIIVDSKVSRKHAEITYDDIQHAYYLTDLNSSNGTVLDNQRLIPGQPVRLSNQSVIGLGPNVILRFDLS